MDLGDVEYEDTDQQIAVLEGRIEALTKELQQAEQERDRLYGAVAACDPVFDGECALCGTGYLDRFHDGPEKHATTCPWRMAKEHKA
jgi:hypothetical protein